MNRDGEIEHEHSYQMISDRERLFSNRRGSLSYHLAFL